MGQRAPPRQIEAFRALEDEEGRPLTHNFRPIQPLGDRVVMYNTDEIVKDVDLTDDDTVETPPDGELEQNLDDSAKPSSTDEEPRKPAHGGRKGAPDSGTTGSTVASWMVLLLTLVGCLVA